jgi:hypothetical protein
MKYFACFCALFLVSVWSVGAQSIEDARRLYAAGKYAEALPLFEGIAASAAKKAEAWKPEAYRALGHIYYISYEFEKSAAAYKQVRSADAAQLAERSARAARMLAHCEDIQLIDSVVVDKESFLAAYLLSSESGRLERRNGTVVYENPLRDKRYFAAEKAGRGKRLYSEIRLQNEWTDRKEIEIPADSLDNNDFPFALSDGLTIYYASDNQASIGGYDLFITRYNLNNDTWLVPSQMGMPFNSIANDYMLAIDEENGVGYFATDRFQEAGRVVIYTFIPNEEVVPLEVSSDRALIRRAKITSIRASWKTGADYRALLEQVRESVGNEAKPVHDFAFVIDDGRVYHAIGDFRADAAKQTFLQWQETKVLMGQQERELDALRAEYAGANAGKRRGLAADILRRETRLESLYALYEVLEKNVRSFELRVLNDNQLN